MRYWAFLSIPFSILIGIGCDKLWSGSVIDCGKPGFPCPQGYSPDMPISDADGGNGKRRWRQRWRWRLTNDGHGHGGDPGWLHQRLRAQRYPAHHPGRD